MSINGMAVLFSGVSDGSATIAALVAVIGPVDVAETLADVAGKPGSAAG
jgi:hypothetical protein